MAAGSSSKSGMGSAAEAGKIPADSIPDHIPTPSLVSFPCCSPGRRREAADASAMAMEASMTREALATVASAAQKVRRIPDMLEAVHMMVELYSPLTPGEVELVSAVYKMVFSDKYNALRTISTLKMEEQQSGKPTASVGLEVYLEVLKGDMEKTCKNVLHIVQNHLMPFCSGEENVVLYTKMVGDVNWILAMVSKVEDKELHVESTLAAYEAASKAAESLSAAHPLRLDVNLTKTAFYFDVMEWPEWATAVAKLALDKAGLELSSLDEESYKRSAEIMGLMEDNLKLWKRPTSPKSEGSSYTNGSPSPPVVPRSGDNSLEEGPSYSDGSPSPPPVSPRSAGPPVASDEFESPGDWGYEFHEGLSPMQIRSRKKLAQMKRGRMG